VHEDFLLEHAGLLVAYTDAVRASWDPAWGPFTPTLMRDFRHAIGRGLTSFLWVDRERRLVTKTPSVRNLDLFHTFFPDAQLLILMRDGRSVVQSCMDTFGWEFERATRMWRDGARAVARFIETTDTDDDYRLLRYEDLLEGLRPTLSDTLRFLGLDPAVFDFASAERLPVRGSSFFFGDQHRRVHWEPVDRDVSFDPKERWRGWDAATLNRFNWLAGDELERFGYGPVAGRWMVRDALKHRSLDGAWRAKIGSRRTAYRIRGVLGDLSRPLRTRFGLTRDP
jgi:hypothetical protein